MNRETQEQGTVTVKELLEHEPLQARLLGGEAHLDRPILDPHPRAACPSVSASDGEAEEGRVLILGRAETAWLEDRTDEEVASAIHGICGLDPSSSSTSTPACLLLAGGVEAPRGLLDAAEGAGVVVLATDLAREAAAGQAERFLEEKLAPRTSLHGVLIQVHDVGTLILGESGIGKSECALDLVDRGHRLVADDLVEVTRRGDVLIGAPPELLRGMMEVRGLGVINVRELFGLTAVMSAKRLHQVVELEMWAPGKDGDRLGLKEETRSILGLDLPLLRIPVTAGRNLAMLVELAARTYLLRREGIRPGAEIQERLRRTMGGGMTDDGHG